MRNAVLVLGLLVGCVSGPIEAQSNDKMMNIVTALNAYTQCLSTNALILGRKSKESADTLVRAAKSKCNVAYLDAAAAYADSGIFDVPSSAQRTAEDRAIATVIEKRAP